MTTQTVEQRVPSRSYSVDRVHSSVGFSVVHNGSPPSAAASRVRGTLTGGDAPRLEGSVDVASIEVDEEQLKGHLLSPEFFDAERHPRLASSPPS